MSLIPGPLKQTNPPSEEIWNHAIDVRPGVHAMFPYVVTIAHYYPDMDLLVRWCWITFGSPRGKCDDKESDFPICPFVLLHKRLMISSDPEDEPIWEPVSPVPDHCHFGSWMKLWLGKTGYNYGNQDYCFSTVQQKELFLAYVAFVSEHHERGLIRP